MNNLQVSLWFVAILVGCIVLGTIIMQLSPVILPFAIAMALSYLTDPLVERLQKYLKFNRTVAVVFVFLVVLLLFAVILFYLIPALSRQISNLIEVMPAVLEYLMKTVVDNLAKFGISTEVFNFDALKENLRSHMKEATQVASWLGNFLFHSSLSLFEGMMKFLIVLVATFYLLRDWQQIIKAAQNLIPKNYTGKTVEIIKQCNEVLSTFLRGQLIVMAALGVYYALALSIVGLRFSLLFGFLIGLLSVVPYLGSILGFAIALGVTLVQFQEWLPIVGVVVIFGIGHILEGMVLTPLLIGDKLGLHPVAVIFAVLAGGQLLGMVGVILALPVAAILMVLFRELVFSKIA